MPELEDGRVKYDALNVLKLLGAEGGVHSRVKVSCSHLADRLDTSDQTVSRRLQSLEDAGAVEREIVADGQWIDVTEEGERLLRSEYEDYRRIFEGESTFELQGEIVTGMGEGSYYIGLEGYQRQFREKLGYEPFEGTLNVELDEDSTRKRSALDGAEGILIEEWENEERTFGAATCYPAYVEDEEAHVIYPHRTHYPDDMLEVIAPVKLFEELGLEHGDHVTVEVQV